MKDFFPNDDEALKHTVRGMAGYGSDDIDDETLEGIIDVGKMRVYTKTGSDKFFSDEGLSQALLDYTLIHTKGRVENIDLSRYSLGDIEVHLETASADDSAQINEWARMVKEGLASSDVYEGLKMGSTGGEVGRTHHETRRASHRW